MSVNDCFRPVCRYFDRLTRPEQLIDAALAAMRVLTDPAETGAVCLALPEDVQTEVVEVPEAFLAERTWTVYRRPPAPDALARAAELIRAARRPLLVAGGGVVYAEATAALRAFADATGIPVAETQAGRGALPSAHPLRARGDRGDGHAGGQPARARGGPGDRRRDALERLHDRVAVGVPGPGRALRQRQRRRRSTRPSRAGSRSRPTHGSRSTSCARRSPATAPTRAWERARRGRGGAHGREEVERLYRAGHGPLPSQAEVIGAVNAAAGERDVVVCAAGSMPGDLHKLWRATDPDGKGYHVEYGYSCMGYEIPGGMGVKLAAPDREVFVMVGDGSYLMLPGRAADRGRRSGSSS